MRALVQFMQQHHQPCVLVERVVFQKHEFATANQLIVCHKSVSLRIDVCHLAVLSGCCYACAQHFHKSCANYSNFFVRLRPCLAAAIKKTMTHELSNAVG